jgi:hypothetical protein
MVLTAPVANPCGPAVLRRPHQWDVGFTFDGRPPPVTGIFTRSLTPARAVSLPPAVPLSGPLPRRPVFFEKNSGLGRGCRTPAPVVCRTSPTKGMRLPR